MGKSSMEEVTPSSNQYVFQEEDTNTLRLIPLSTTSTIAFILRTFGAKSSGGIYTAE